MIMGHQIAADSRLGLVVCIADPMAWNRQLTVCGCHGRRRQGEGEEVWA
ncbi:MAG: hypothetical protein NZM29_00935 [Nitrospira sp.]|nr:hypothetical protein [Nitrospira sp.]